MKLLRKLGAPSNEEPLRGKGVYFIMLLFVGIMTLLSGMILVWRFKPVPPNDVPSVEAMANRPQPDKMEPLRVTIRERLETFRARQEARKVDMEDLNLLEETIALQRDVIRAQDNIPPDHPDLAVLETLQQTYDSEMGLFLLAQSRRFEKEAETAHDRGDDAKALAALEKARNLQEKINNGLRLSSSRDPSRLHILENRLIDWRTDPIAKEADALFEEAFTLREQHQYAEATRRMERSLKMQRRLNEEFRTSTYALHARLRTFEIAWDTIRAAEQVDTVRDLMAEARSLLDSGDPGKALEKVRQVSHIYNQLQKTYKSLSELPDTVPEEIHVLEDTAASKTTLDALLQHRETCRTLLRNKDLDGFTGAVSEWLRETRAFLTHYPKSLYIQSLNLEEVEFLHEHREVLPNILDTIYANLTPAKSGSYSMYRTEVPQYLYDQVSGHNPSSNRGALYPVDSITWEEAHRFMERLSWILAYPVSLPTREQYLNILEKPVSSNEVWSSGSAKRETQPVGTSEPNASGFWDLLGNVSEWLDLTDGASESQAPVFGGSVRDDYETLLNFSEAFHGIQERNRFTGFRFVVRFPE